MNNDLARLSDLLQFADGRPLTSPGDWPARRQEWLDAVIEIEYGGMPPAPATVSGELLHQHEIRDFHNASHRTYRLTTGPGRGLSFILDLLLPPGDGPFPVIVVGDGCWRHGTDLIRQETLRRGYAVAEFNRVEIVPDNGRADRTSGLYQVYPEGHFGALSAWAWGYHRCVDWLVTQPIIDAGKIIATGHSRGGKAALLAGVTDARIAITAPNNSGCGGAGCFHIAADGSEKIADILRYFSYWFGPRFPEYAGRDESLPFDQHVLKAAVAPRALLTTEALDDKWANPYGTQCTHLAAKRVFDLLGVGDRIGISFRPGGHAQTLADWSTLMDFADWQLNGKTVDRRFDRLAF